MLTISRREAFWRGFGITPDIEGNACPLETEVYHPRFADLYKDRNLLILAEDWAIVGDDLRASFKEFERSENLTIPSQ